MSDDLVRVWGIGPVAATRLLSSLMRTKIVPSAVPCGRKVIVKEPAPDDALRILKGISGCFEKYHSIKIEDAALMSAVFLSKKHISDQYLPGKAIALIDGAAACCRMKGVDRVKEADIMMEVERMQKM